MMGLSSLAGRFFGSANDRRLRAYTARVASVNALEDTIRAKSDGALRADMDAAREKARAGAPLDELLAPVFALVREAARRALGQRPFDVQLMGAMALHEGRIAEMKTGEGKTLAATLPCCLNALAGGSVHVVTVNDYLAGRDADWMGKIYGFLGFSTGCILHGIDDEERRQAYAADITYGTNNELGFDYLRDNMKYRIEDMVQRGHDFAIVDEVDSILIDEARTPLIISGALEDKADSYIAVDALIPSLEPEDYEIEEKTRTITLSEAGNEHVEALLRERDLLKGDNLYDVENVSLVHHVNQALRAHKLFTRDKDYIVKDDKVIIIDEFTGRMMPGRRYSEGLHQALEAKEGVSVESENQTLASITFQNYFRLYKKLAGMTGTAMTEANEFLEIYGLPVLSVPTNMDVCREDFDDEIYRTAQDKYNAIIETIAECHKRGQPVLVGTTSIERSESLAASLKKAQVAHHVLNARYHEQEAQIIAQAGAPGAVTIATNMAGRGTDIQLGGNLDMRLAQEIKPDADDTARAEAQKRIEEDIAAKKKIVIAEGGLAVLGTERHESRRIDNQLRGRSGRQGDPGASKFFISLDDDLMRIFGSERMGGMLQKLGLKEGEAIVHPWINKALEKAQMRVEARNFDTRKNLLKYDNVMNDQRKAIFEQRLELITGEDVSEVVADMRGQVIDNIVATHIPERAYPEEWDTKGLTQEAKKLLGVDVSIGDWAQEEGIADEEIRTRLGEAATAHMAAATDGIGADVLADVEKTILLQTLDARWREHLLRLEHLRQVIGLRGYGQRDPLNEYKTEAFSLFEGLLGDLRADVVRQLMTMQITLRPAPEADMPQMQFHHDAPGGALAALGDALPPPPQAQPTAAPQLPVSSSKVPRNAPCPCGSGRKYKHCHGKAA